MQMPKVLLISSTVASSRVGASAAGFCLERLGIETITLPTTLMGRHPGWGDPGGGAVSTQRLQDMWVAISKQNLNFDAVLTGYMGETGHIDLCSDIIADLKSRHSDIEIWVDPVMGDHGQLYISEDRANALRDKLIPLADCITPNLWELSWLTGKPLKTPDAIRHAIEPFEKALITSVPDGEKIGAVWSSKTANLMCSHQRFENVPHGGGDSLSAILLAHHLWGREERMALMRALGSIFDIMKAAQEMNATELPLIRCQDALIRPNRLDVSDYA